MNGKHWILESAILLALGTGVLYAFGHFYDYRMRFEFGIHTISLNVSPETFIHDGATVVFAWMGSTIEFWVALSLLLAITILIVFLNRKSRKVHTSGVVLVSLIIGFTVLYVSVIRYIPSRAQYNAHSIEKLASLKRHSLIFENGEMIEGYTIIGTPSKVAFRTTDSRVLVVQYTDIKRIVVNPDS